MDEQEHEQESDDEARMALRDLAEPLVRIVAECFGEVVIKGVGYVVAKYGWYFGKRSPNPDGPACVLVGLAFWISTNCAGIRVYSHGHRACPMFLHHRSDYRGNRSGPCQREIHSRGGSGIELLLRGWPRSRERGVAREVGVGDGSPRWEFNARGET